MSKNINAMEAFRDQILKAGEQESLAAPLLPAFFSAIAFSLSFAAGFFSNFILFQFLIGVVCYSLLKNSSALIFQQRNKPAPKDLGPLFENRDPLFLSMLESHWNLLAGGRTLPLQSGGLMIIGYYLVKDISAAILLASSLSLGLLYGLLGLIEARISGRAKWRKASRILNVYLDEKRL